MRTFRLTLAYDGTRYAGWQSQSGQLTLQDTLEQAIQRITREPVRVVASGRTDAGVHALGQVVGFRSETQLEPHVLLKALNAELPLDMAVLDVALTADNFHAIKWAVRKRYRYLVHDGTIRDVFARQYAWHLFTPLDAEAMHRAALGLVGTHDFKSFETSGSPRGTSVRTVLELSVARLEATSHPLFPATPGRLISLEIEADGFLYNMVRAIVGTLIQVGQGRRAESWPAEVMAACDRRAAGRTAPAHGLFLIRVNY